MESSTVLAFRALVMLACLILVPLAAIFGSAFPDVVKSVLVDKISALTGSAKSDSPPPFAAIGAAPPNYSPSGATPGASVNANSVRTAAAWSPAGLDSGPSRYIAPSTQAASLSVAPQWGAKAAPPNASGAGMVGGDPFAAQANVPNPANAYEMAARPAAQLENAPRAETFPNAGPYSALNAPGDLTKGPTSEGLPAHASAGDVDRFTQIEIRLRKLGSVYYVLEAWDSDTPRYRFYCRMSIDGDRNVTRQFEALDSDPLRGMAQVLQEVEAWRQNSR